MEAKLRHLGKCVLSKRGFLLCVALVDYIATGSDDAETQRFFKVIGGDAQQLSHSLEGDT